MIRINSPKLWQFYLKTPSPQDNKYTRGYAVIIGAQLQNGSTGASKLAAYAALRSGAGLVSIITDKETAAIYAASCSSVMVKISDPAELLKDERVTSVLVGPGNGVNSNTKANVLKCLGSGKNICIDADGISVFKDSQTELFKAIHSDCILTPHEGEFARIFSLSEDKVASCIAAAKISKATILLKGHDTIIASPSGECIINKNAPSTLATAGSGDILAGLITGFMAQGINSFTAAAIACYIHSQAAKLFGTGLISEDLLNKIPLVLKELLD